MPLRKTQALILLLVLTCGLFWRFVNFENRWTLGQDQARDVIVARYLLEEGIMPLIGPPSSLGYFSFGPYYYWIIMFFVSVFPTLNGAWIGFALLSTLSVTFITIIGKLLAGSRGMLVFGLLGAFASASIFHSVDVLNPMLVPFFVSLALLAVVLIVEKQLVHFAIILGLAIGLAINAHFQAIGLMCLLPALLFLGKLGKKQNLIIAVEVTVGFLFTFLPLLYYNFTHQNLLLDKLYQGLVSEPVGGGIRWLWIKDPLVTWPKLVGEALFFQPNLGYILLPLVCGLIGYFWRTKKLSKSFVIILVTLMAQALCLVLYTGARAPVYLLVFHPFIILLTAWVIVLVLGQRRVLGVMLIGLFLAISIWSNAQVIQGYTQRPLITELKSKIVQKGELIDLYSNSSSHQLSLPLFYLLKFEDKISQNGVKIGVCDEQIKDGTSSCSALGVPFLKKERYALFDLQNVSSENFQKMSLERILPQDIYERLNLPPLY